MYLFVFNNFYQTNYLKIYPTDLRQNFSFGLKLVFDPCWLYPQKWFPVTLAVTYRQKFMGVAVCSRQLVAQPSALTLSVALQFVRSGRCTDGG